MSDHRPETAAAMIETIVTRLAAAPPPAAGPRILAIDGPSGSGKTTLAAGVAEALGGAPVVALDRLYPGWDGLAPVVRPLVESLLAPAAAGREAGYHRYDWDAGRSAEWQAVVPGAYLVVEGAGAGSRAAAPYLSLLVWLEAPESIRYERAMARDGDAYRPHWKRWARQERVLFARERTRARADLAFATDPATPPGRGGSGGHRIRAYPFRRAEGRSGWGVVRWMRAGSAPWPGSRWEACSSSRA